jgi:RNA polymerase subunit RPABC4/transcription elongation factor Spt4
MKNRKHNLEIKTRLLILLLTLVSFTPLVLLGIFYFGLNWKILIPIEIIVIVSIQAVLHLFFRPDKHCPQCDAPVSIYAEECPNCGLKLLKKCSNCGTIMSREATVCPKCGKEHKILIISDDTELEFDHIPQNEKSYSSEKACPHCGTILRAAQKDKKYCDLCGGKL